MTEVDVNTRFVYLLANVDALDHVKADLFYAFGA